MKITLNTIDRVFKAKTSSVETMELQGFTLIDELFVDSSGFGAPNEPALTKNQFITKLEALLKEHGELTAKLTGVGQFQAFVGLFKREKRGLVKRLSPSVFEREESGQVVRLYDTDIVKISPDGNSFTLNSGGYETPTTKKWINRYIYPRWFVYQKAFTWYVRDTSNNKDIEFKDGMTIEA